MKSLILAAIVLGSLVSACAFRSERTVVERPAPAQTAYVYTAPPPPPTTVYVGP